MTTAKVDLFRLHRAEYSAKESPSVIRIAPAQYLAVTGKGAPGGAEFERALGALYSVAYAAKMASKSRGRDYAVAKLEGQWWLDQGYDYRNVPRETWNWRLLIRVPEFIGKPELDAARRQLEQKGKGEDSCRVELYLLSEGDCVQALHAGPYDSEPETIDRMHREASAAGYEFSGLHHEIYLTDPRRTEPARLKTILRMPVVKAGRGSARAGSSR